MSRRYGYLGRATRWIARPLDLGHGSKTQPSKARALSARRAPGNSKPLHEQLCTAEASCLAVSQDAIGARASLARTVWCHSDRVHAAHFHNAGSDFHRDCELYALGVGHVDQSHEFTFALVARTSSTRTRPPRSTRRSRRWLAPPRRALRGMCIPRTFCSGPVRRSRNPITPRPAVIDQGGRRYSTRPPEFLSLQRCGSFATVLAGGSALAWCRKRRTRG
jgi:hypothetical protein